MFLGKENIASEYSIVQHINNHYHLISPKYQHITYSDAIALYIKHFKYFRGWLWNILLWCIWITWKSLEKIKQFVSTTENQNTNDILSHLVPKLRAMPFSWTVNVFQIAKTTLYVYTNLQKTDAMKYGVYLALCYYYYITNTSSGTFFSRKPFSKQLLFCF